MKFSNRRLQRYRKNSVHRELFSMEKPAAEKFMWPVFVVPGTSVKSEIDSMPGQYRMSADILLKECEKILEMGISSILLFGVTDDSKKDNYGSEACNKSGYLHDTVRRLKSEFGDDLLVTTDVCLCAYTNHGHCAPLDENGSILNDDAVEMLGKIAVSHAEAGADCVAPSAMMDFQVESIRVALDSNGFHSTLLMSYSTKFASSLYGPFRDAENSSPGNGNRKNYQASYSDIYSAILESKLDEAEGADILMVKPSLYYLDIITKLKEITDLPLAAYNVSGEYSMIHAMAEKGWGELYPMAAESLFALKRAGVDIIISYWANQYREIFDNYEF